MRRRALLAVVGILVAGRTPARCAEPVIVDAPAEPVYSMDEERRLAEAIAKRAKMPPALIWDLRRTGLSWTKVAALYGLAFEAPPVPRKKRPLARLAAEPTAGPPAVEPPPARLTPLANPLETAPPPPPAPAPPPALPPPPDISPPSASSAAASAPVEPSTGAAGGAIALSTSTQIETSTPSARPN